jgi:hypothetical protein
MAELLSEGIVVRNGAVGATTGTTAVDGAAFDMTGFDGVLIIAAIATNNAGNFLKGQQGEAANLTDAADLAGSKVLFPGDAKIAVLDIDRPRERYVRGVIVRAGATTVSERMLYIGYHASNRPTAMALASEVAVTKLVSPAEGTP